MNRYFYVIMLCVFSASPCFAMLNPFAYGQIQSPSPEQEVSEPEFPSGSIYGMNVITGEQSDEPSSYTPEQVQEESLLPEEFPEEPTEQQPIEKTLKEYQQEAMPQVQTSVQQTPTPISPAAPAQQPSATTLQPSSALSAPAVSPIAPSAPVAQPPVKPTAPGKAHESITKANSKLSSALRRLDAIKGYYKEVPQEERRVIKKKAENVLKEYEGGITKFAHRIGQVKNELGARVDKDKLAPFNTFIDLVNKLSQGIKRL